MKHFIFGLLLGAGIGSGVTYFICKSHFKKTLEEERKKIRAEYKEYYERKQEEEDEAKVKHVKAIPDKPVEMKEYKEIVQSYDRAELERPTEEDLIEETENINKMHDALAKSHDRVKLIKIDHFGEINSYECESLTYYVYDKTLCHENGDIVDDPSFLLGDALDRYGWADDDSDTEALYCRNYAISKDFEVVKVLGEYPEQ